MAGGLAWRHWGCDAEARLEQKGKAAGHRARQDAGHCRLEARAPQDWSIRAHGYIRGTTMPRWRWYLPERSA